jgi:hypothetical protein
MEDRSGKPRNCSSLNTGFKETEDDLFNGPIPLRQNLTSQDLTCYVDLMDATPGAKAPILR